MEINFFGTFSWSIIKLVVDRQPPWWVSLTCFNLAVASRPVPMRITQWTYQWSIPIAVVPSTHVFPMLTLHSRKYRFDPKLHQVHVYAYVWIQLVQSLATCNLSCKSQWIIPIPRWFSKSLPQVANGSFKIPSKIPSNDKGSSNVISILSKEIKQLYS